MSDPLSFIASLVSLLDIGARSANGLRHLVLHYYHAGDEFIALYNELDTDLSLFEQVRQDIGQDPPPRLIEAVEGVKRKLDESVIVFDSLSESQPSGEKFSRFGWLNKRSTAKRLQEELERVRQHLEKVLYE